MLTLITQWSIGYSEVALIMLWGVYWWTYQAFEMDLTALAIIPVLFGSWASVQIALPPAFAMRGLSAFWLMLKLHRFKDQRCHFELERFGLLGIALVACVIFAVGLFAPWLGERSISWPTPTSLRWYLRPSFGYCCVTPTCCKTPLKP